MGFFRKMLGKVTKPIQKLGPVGDIATAIALTLAGQPHLIPLVAGAKTYGSGGSIGDSLLSAGASYAGAKVGGSLFPGNVGSTAFSAMPGGSISNFIQNSIPAALANASVGAGIGGSIGETLANNYTSDSAPKPQMPAVPAGPAPFQAKQEAEEDLPASLSGFGSLNPQQRSTNIATKGVFGSGVGPQETSYFLNQANRRLVDPMGNVDRDFSDLSDIETQFLRKQGLGMGGVSNLLEGISKWRMQPQAA